MAPRRSETRLRQGQQDAIDRSSSVDVAVRSKQRHVAPSCHAAAGAGAACKQKTSRGRADRLVLGDAGDGGLFFTASIAQSQWRGRRGGGGRGAPLEGRRRRRGTTTGGRANEKRRFVTQHAPRTMPPLSFTVVIMPETINNSSADAAVGTTCSRGVSTVISGC